MKPIRPFTRRLPDKGIREGKMKKGGTQPVKGGPRPDVKPQGKRRPCYLYPCVFGMAASTPQLAFCPNCSLPRRPLNWTGEVFNCGGCGGWWTRPFMETRPELFSLNPGPPDGPEAA